MNIEYKELTEGKQTDNTKAMSICLYPSGMFGINKHITPLQKELKFRAENDNPTKTDTLIFCTKDLLHYIDEHKSQPWLRLFEVKSHSTFADHLFRYFGGCLTEDYDWLMYRGSDTPYCGSGDFQAQTLAELYGINIIACPDQHEYFREVMGRCDMRRSCAESFTQFLRTLELPEKPIWYFDEETLSRWFREKNLHAVLHVYTSARKREMADWFIQRLSYGPRTILINDHDYTQFKPTHLL